MGIALGSPAANGLAPLSMLSADGHRVTGSGGCNELVGTYSLNGQALQMLRPHPVAGQRAPFNWHVTVAGSS